MIYIYIQLYNTNKMDNNYKVIDTNNLLPYIEKYNINNFENETLRIVEVPNTITHIDRGTIDVLDEMTKTTKTVPLQGVQDKNVSLAYAIVKSIILQVDDFRKYKYYTSMMSELPGKFAIKMVELGLRPNLFKPPRFGDKEYFYLWNEFVKSIQGELKGLPVILKVYSLNDKAYCIDNVDFNPTRNADLIDAVYYFGDAITRHPVLIRIVECRKKFSALCPLVKFALLFLDSTSKLSYDRHISLNKSIYATKQIDLKPSEFPSHVTSQTQLIEKLREDYERTQKEAKSCETRTQELKNSVNKAMHEVQRLEAQAENLQEAQANKKSCIIS